jgi:hypothetical protein
MVLQFNPAEALGARRDADQPRRALDRGDLVIRRGPVYARPRLAERVASLGQKYAVRPCRRLLLLELRCLIPWFDGAIHSQEWKDAIWDRYVTAAPRPRTLSEQQYSDRKLQPRS